MSDTIRVRLGDDYYLHELFDTSPQTWWSESDVYDVPREQVERWQAAQGAWEAAQQEMATLMSERCERQWAGQAERQQREDARRVEIQRGLYGRGGEQR